MSERMLWQTTLRMRTARARFVNGDGVDVVLDEDPEQQLPPRAERRGSTFPNICDSHTIKVMESELEQAVNEWHAAVNVGDLHRSAAAVGDPIVVLGPKGAGPIRPGDFAAWVERSGIRLVPRSWHPISERLMVVEEDATWPANQQPTRVATVFRVYAGKVTAALRLPDLRSALELAYVCREMAATE